MGRDQLTAIGVFLAISTKLVRDCSFCAFSPYENLAKPITARSAAPTASYFQAHSGKEGGL